MQYDTFQQMSYQPIAKPKCVMSIDSYGGILLHS